MQEENIYQKDQEELDKSSVHKERGIDWITILSISIVMFAVISLSLIQTYINKEIYYESREISKIQKEYNILKEEQVSLKNSINHLRYENLVVDMISDIEAKKDMP